MTDHVIVRDSTNHPLRRQALEIKNGLVYVMQEGAADAVERGEIDAVGFPINDVFIDTCGDIPSPIDWSILRPYGL